MPAVPPQHVHANVPIVSAADLHLTESPVAERVWELPLDALPEPVRGRDDILGELRSHGRGVVVFTGPGGYGKTTVALAAAKELAGDQITFWVAAHDRACFIEGMAAVAGELRADAVEIARAREEASSELVWRLLSARHLPTRIVLVIDNVDDPELTSDVVRQAQALPDDWLVLVTTRVKPGRPASKLARTVEVDRLPVEVNAEILLDRIPGMDQARRRRESGYAQRVAQQLGHVPLALHVAGSYLGSTLVRHTLAEYSAELGRAPVRRPGLHAEEPAYFVLPAMNLTLAALGHEERDAAVLLLGLLSAGAPGQPFPVATLLTPAEPLTERSLRLLAHTGLVNLSTYDMQPVAVVHPLIARAAAHVDGMRAAPERGAGLLDSVTAALESGSAAYLEPGADPWPLWRLVLPHITHLMANPASRGNVAGLRSSHRSVQHLLHRGMYHSATDLAVVAADRSLGLTDRDAATHRTAILDRGLALQARALVTLPEANTTSDLKRAFDDINEVAQITRRACQPDDPEAMRAGHCLAVILYETGKLTESEHLLKQVLEARRRVLGEDHADTMITKQCLAATLLAAGGEVEAEQILKTVLAARERDLGLLHPDTVATRHSLAYAHQAVGGPDWLEEADRHFGEVLRDRYDILGPTHPNTLITMHNVAWLDQARGHFAEAEQGFRAVLATQLKRLGKIHPHTVAVAANLAWVLLLQRQFPASRQIFTQVLKIRTTRLGTEHPDSQTTRGNLGWLTYEEGDFLHAERRFTKLYEDRKRLLGSNRPRTLTTRHNRALSLRSQHKLVEARDEFIKVRDAQVGELAEDHDSTLATKYNLAVTLRMLNSPEWLTEAMSLLDEVLDALRGRQDPHNPLLRQTKREIVTLLAIKSGRADVHDLVDDADSFVDTPTTAVDDPLIQDFVDDDIDDFPDPDLMD
jgi:tetratricopeptide (TPR) repeat protein